MRTFFRAIAVVLLPAALAAAPAAPAGTPDKERDEKTQRLTVAILPPVGEGAALEELSFLIQARATAILRATGRTNDVHVKQVVSMTRHHGLALPALKDVVQAKLAGRHLGAARVVFGELKNDKGALMLALTAADVGSARMETALVPLPSGTAAAVAEGGRALATALLRLEGAAPKKDEKISAVNPQTASDAAMKSYGECYAVLVRQPIGIENPTVLREEELGKAIASCKDAVTADPGFASAHAALALALAIKGSDKEAIDALLKVKPEQGFEPLYWVARFWLVARFQSNEAGTGILREAIAKEPGFLLARGFLAEHLNATGKHAEALVAWQEYLATSPGSPFVLSRLGYTLAKLGKHDEAIARSKEALQLDPGSVDLSLELASRYVDAGKLELAVATLEPLAAKPDARGEVVLRLGYAELLSGKIDAAEALLKRAVALSGVPAEWRSRGRARYDLAKISLKRGKKDEAQDFIALAVRDGYKPSFARDDKDFVDFARKAEVNVPVRDADAEKLRKADLSLRPRETSPFSLSDAGEIEPGQRRPKPPENFEILRFGR